MYHNITFKGDYPLLDRRSCWSLAWLRQAGAIVGAAIMLSAAPLSEAGAVKPPAELRLLIIPEDILIGDVTEKVDTQRSAFDLISNIIGHGFGVTNLQVSFTTGFASAQYVVGDLDARLLSPRIIREDARGTLYANPYFAKERRRLPIIDESVMNDERMGSRILVRGAFHAELNHVPYNFEENIATLNGGKSVSRFSCSFSGDASGFVDFNQKPYLHAGYDNKQASKNCQNEGEERDRIMRRPFPEEVKWIILSGFLIGIGIGSFYSGLLIWRSWR